MKRVLTALVLIPLVLLAILRAPVPLLALIVAAVAVLATREFLDLVEKYNVRPFRIPTYIYVVLLFLAVALAANLKPLLAAGAGLYAVGFGAVMAPFIFAALGMMRAELSTAYPAAAASVFAFAYIGLPLGLLVQVRQQWAGAILLVYLMIVVWAGDTLAYYVGRAVGRHKMAPRISPKKTWEGAAASLIASVGFGVLFLAKAQVISGFLLSHHLIDREQGYFAMEPFPAATAIVLSVLLNVAAQVGDLVESLLKRGADVKDSGGLLPGHGGILDRIDALLFAAPVLWYYAAWRVMS